MCRGRCARARRRAVVADGGRLADGHLGLALLATGHLPPVGDRELQPARHQLVLAPFIQNACELVPCFGCRVLSAELTLAIAPTAKRHNSCDPLINATRKNRDRRTKAMPRQCNAVRVNFFALGDEGQCVARVGHLIVASHLATRAFGLTASPEINAKDAIAHVLDHTGDKLNVGLVFRSNKPVKNNESRKTLPRLARLGHMKNAGQLQAI